MGGAQSLSFGPDEIRADTVTATWAVKIVLIRKGQVTISVGGREYTLQEGDTFNFESNLKLT